MDVHENWMTTFDVAVFMSLGKHGRMNLASRTGSRAVANTSMNRSTFQRPERPTARARLARSTPSTKSPNTKPARYASHDLRSPENQVRCLTRCAGLFIRPGKATIRPKAVRIRWSNKACFPQESEDNQEGRAQIGMCQLQN